MIISRLTKQFSTPAVTFDSDWAEKNAVSVADARHAFAKLQSIGGVLNDYSLKACDSVALVHGVRLSEMGHRPRKVVARGALKGIFALKFQPRQGDTIRHGFHVAACLSVRNENGEIDIVAMDTAMLDQPQSIKDWGILQNAKSINVLSFSSGYQPDPLRPWKIISGTGDNHKVARNEEYARALDVLTEARRGYYRQISL